MKILPLSKWIETSRIQIDIWIYIDYISNDIKTTAVYNCNTGIFDRFSLNKIPTKYEDMIPKKIKL